MSKPAVPADLFLAGERDNNVRSKNRLHGRRDPSPTATVRQNSAFFLNSKTVISEAASNCPFVELPVRHDQLDFAIHRQFALTEGMSLQFRAEFFNIFNHPNFADPENNLAMGALFGQSLMMLGHSLGGLNPLYQIGGPRSTQFALRLQF